MHKKHKCCCCGNIATWYNEYGNNKNGLYYCDSCIKRGSISNVDNIEDFGEPHTENSIMWWDKNAVAKDLLQNGSLQRTKDSFYYEILDEKNRRNPSNDYTFNQNGFFIEETDYYVYWDDISSVVEELAIYLSAYDYLLIKDIISDIFIKYRTKDDRTKILYNLLMSKLGHYMRQSNIDYATPPIYNICIRKFFINLKKKLSKKKA